MKKIWNDVRSSFVVATNKRPVLVTSMVLLALNLAFVIVMAFAMIFTIPDFYGKYWLSLATMFGYLTGSIGASSIAADPRLHALSSFVRLIGVLSFSGTIIAIITTSLREFIIKRGAASGKLNIGGHIVILGYNNEVPEILIDLMYCDDVKTVLVLSKEKQTKVKQDLESHLFANKEKPDHKLRLIVRQGNPESLVDLEEIRIERASGVLIMNENKGSSEAVDKLSGADYDVLKIALSLSHFDLPEHLPIGIETSSQVAGALMAKIGGDMTGFENADLQYFSYNEKLGQILALAAICPEVPRVFADALSYNEGEFYPLDTQETQEEYLAHHDRSIPVIATDGKLYVFAQDLKKTHSRYAQPFVTDRRLEYLNKSAVVNGVANLAMELFVIGDSRKLKYMLNELNANVQADKIHRYKKEDIKEFVNGVATSTQPNIIAVILSDDSVKEEDYDANVFLTLIELSNVIGIKNRKCVVVAEIINHNNKANLEKFNINNIVVSTRFISTFATKLLSDKHALRFYENIFSFSREDDKIDLWVAPAKDLFKINATEHFSSVAELVHAAYYGSGKKIILLGIFGEKQSLYFDTILTKPNFTLKGDDKLIYCELK